MGGTRYNLSKRALKAQKEGYASKSINEIFKQNRERRAHNSMNPNGVDFREARDSEVHPNSFPIILALDVTGSMGHIPHDLIKEGLPKLMGGIIQNGAEDVALLFLGIGDHECDSYPLQVGQFESGDEELDMWLTRTYIESGGGGNAGESYLLSWYFAAFHTRTDAFEKRNQKGILFTIGDEPNLKHLPASAIQEIMGSGQQTFSEMELFQEVQKKYDVFHISVNHSGRAIQAEKGWKQLLGDNCISVSDYRTIPEVITKVVCENYPTASGKTDISGVNFDDIEML
ncbi:hypothetical protein [Tenacibaculum jejuense]|uniref:VWFA domain-containing protein n=1 Tax=Tenacibaculum jejuense TaxID=584609 RepID=A0A238UAA1_9FLAO|nr:hypothetical protein [Tenacibaculum jejuense]SNR16133.1 Protein of unknown function [Tenacibaculum jejuense]